MDNNYCVICGDIIPKRDMVCSCCELQMANVYAICSDVDRESCDSCQIYKQCESGKIDSDTLGEIFVSLQRHMIFYNLIARITKRFADAFAKLGEELCQVLAANRSVFDSTLEIREVIRQFPSCALRHVCCYAHLEKKIRAPKICIRHLWETIKALFRPGRTQLISTHNSKTFRR